MRKMSGRTCADCGAASAMILLIRKRPQCRSRPPNVNGNWPIRVPIGESGEVKVEVRQPKPLRPAHGGVPK